METGSWSRWVAEGRWRSGSVEEASTQPTIFVSLSKILFAALESSLKYIIISCSQSTINALTTTKIRIDGEGLEGLKNSSCHRRQRTWSRCRCSKRTDRFRHRIRLKDPKRLLKVLLSMARTFVLFWFTECNEKLTNSGLSDLYTARW